MATKKATTKRATEAETAQVLFDYATEKVLLRSSISRTAQALVCTYGTPDIAALDKLIEMLAVLRNGWAEEAAQL